MPPIVALCLLTLTAEPGLLFHATFDDTLTAAGPTAAVEPAGIEGPAAEYAPGKFGQALVAGQSRTRVSYPTAGTLMPQAGSVSLWIQARNWTPTSGGFHVFFEAGGPPNGWLLLYKYFEKGHLYLRYADEDNKLAMAQTVPAWQPGEWHHLAGTWTISALRLYLDGQLVHTAPTAVVAQTFGDIFQLGDAGWHVPEVGAETLLDDVRIYSYALTAAQVRRLAGAGQLQVSRHPAGDRWRLSSELPNPAAVRGEAVVVPAAGGEPVARAELVLAGDRLQGEVDVAAVEAGEYQVLVHGLAEDGTELFGTRAPMRRLAEPRVVLANDQVRLTFDGGNGGLLAIDALGPGSLREARPAASPWRVDTVSFPAHARFFDPTDVVTVAGDESTLSSLAVEPIDGGQRLTATYALHPHATATMTVELPDDATVATFRLRVDNRRPARPSEAIRVPRLDFPVIDGLRVGENSAEERLANGYIHGHVWPDPAGNLPPERAMMYPGRASNPWLDLYDGDGGLALLPLADGSTQLEVVPGAVDGAVRFINRWHPVIEPGEVWESPAIELRLHDGIWYDTADRFREWSLARTPPRPQPDWLATCDGWYGYGSPHYKFAELGKLLAAGQSYGLSYLQLWSQMILGAAYYSWFYPNPDLGTIAELKAGLKEVQEQGGHVGFYSNAIVFDAAVDQNPQLQELLDQYQINNHPPLPRFWDEAQRAIFVGPAGAYGKASAEGHSVYGYPDGYWAMDPASAWWRDYLAGWIDRWEDDYGADVWYLDSFPIAGYGLAPASYALHLDRPVSLSAGQLGLLQAIRERFDGPLLYEGVVCPAFMPYTNWGLGTELSFGPSPEAVPEIYTYSFGDLHPVFSGTANRWAGVGAIYGMEDPRHEDAMSHVFLLGERFDVLAIGAYDQNDPYSVHLKRLIDLRAKVRDVIYGGRMLDRRGLAGMPEGVEARIFIGQDPVGAVVTVWDRRETKEPWTLTIDPAALPWPAGLAEVTWLGLDGSETPLNPAGGTLTIPAGEVGAVRWR